MGRLTAATAALAITAGALLTSAGPAAGFPPMGRGVRMNQVQVIGTHNSYHRELSFAEQQRQRESDHLWYSHPSLPAQFGQEGVRQIELDVMPDSDAGGLYTRPLIRQAAGLGPLTDPDMAKPGLKVMHWADHDYGTSCVAVVTCLRQVVDWSRQHRGHAPIAVLLELKQTDPAMEQQGGPKSPPWDDQRFAALDAEIRSVVPAEQLITPDTLRRPGLTLEQSVLRSGWPSLDQARGKFVFLMDNKDPKVQAPYLAGRPNLEGRVLFTDSAPGRADAAFLEQNDPRGANTAQIQDWVRRGYLVRTRADEPFDAASTGDTTRLKAALASGAQLVSTDFPVPGLAARYGSDYVAELPGHVPLRCNPVNAPWYCRGVPLE
ncbi:phosphatidylinositol-specific phospholipase C1-like protein [Actinocrispum wychmicini]|uniref:Calcium-dependent phosphoinositide phospholipase C n=1 Tax=Actinocrispum wychmicini TaxID=1213861 RepID=A0A4R2JHS6_9PSEU|nr:phosphatidylinositol-specific phospholipase C1-like protein [Actinocrispum wychmicini]TCO55949.1 calcium-dependent phosphoinositide phospholipase C [Actinocrispum wychmicini]